MNIYIILFCLFFLFIFLYFFYKLRKENFKINNLIYSSNFFDNNLKNIIKIESEKLIPYLQSDQKNSAVNRKHFEIPNDHILYNIFYNKNTLNTLSKILNIPIKSSYIVPIEYRSYEKDSYMDWHKDSILSNPPQIEVVYTIYNTSDSFTEWLDSEKRLHKIKSEPNSIIIVHGGGVLHRVSKMTNGYRTIIKVVYEQSI